MDETLAAITARLRPSNLVKEFLGGGGNSGHPNPSDPNDSGYDRDSQRSSGGSSSGSSLLGTVVSSVASSMFNSSKEPDNRRGHSSGYRHNWNDSGSSSFGVTSLITGTAAPAAAWAGKRLLKFASHHPIPAAVIAAGVAYYVYESAQSDTERIRDEDEMYSGSYVDARTGQPYDRDTYGREFRGGQGGQGGQSGQQGRPSPAGAYGSASVRQDAAGTLYEDEDSEDGGAGRSRIGRAADRTRGAVASAGHAASQTGSRLSAAGSRAYGSAGRAGGAVINGVYYSAEQISHGTRTAADAAKHGAQAAGGAILHGVYYTKDQIASGSKAAAESAAHGAQAAGGALLDGVYYTADQIAHGTSTAASAIMHGAQSAGGAILDGVHYTTEQLSEGAATVAEYLHYGYDQSKRGAASALDDYPFALGLAVMALGALAGLAVPETRKENRLMGSTRNDLLKRAKALGQDYYESGKHVAEATVNAAAGEAEGQGLTATDLKSRVKNVAGHLMENMKDSVKKTIQEEHLTPDEIKGRAEKVVSTAKDTAKSEARKEGLTDADKAKQHAEAAKDSVKSDMSGNNA